MPCNAFLVPLLLGVAPRRKEGKRSAWAEAQPDPVRARGTQPDKIGRAPPREGRRGRGLGEWLSDALVTSLGPEEHGLAGTPTSKTKPESTRKPAGVQLEEAVTSTPSNPGKSLCRGPPIDDGAAGA